MNRLFTIVVIAGALLLGSATAQYGNPYGYPSDNPNGYDPNAYMYGYPSGYQPMMPGVGYYDPAMDGMGYYDPNQYLGSPDAVIADLLRQSEAQIAYLEQLQAQTDAQYNEALAQVYQYFINFYRTTTGDQTSPDATALYYGQVIHCQQYPVDCETAARNAQANAAATAANTGTSNDAWLEEQRRKDAAHDNFIRTVIRGEGEYTSAAGDTQILPFAPSQNTYYQTPAGAPLVFDSSSNTWYQIDASGNYTPYYGAP